MEEGAEGSGEGEEKGEVPTRSREMRRLVSVVPKNKIKIKNKFKKMKEEKGKKIEIDLAINFRAKNSRKTSHDRLEKEGNDVNTLKNDHSHKCQYYLSFLQNKRRKYYFDSN